jgi:hypothetical protein
VVSSACVAGRANIGNRGDRPRATDANTKTYWHCFSGARNYCYRRLIASLVGIAAALAPQRMAAQLHMDDRIPSPTRPLAAGSLGQLLA